MTDKRLLSYSATQYTCQLDYSISMIPGSQVSRATIHKESQIWFTQDLASWGLAQSDTYINEHKLCWQWDRQEPPTQMSIVWPQMVIT